MTDPLVSIIMRSFNEGWALRQTLPALRWQTYRNWELIVIDSGSADGSQDLIRSVSPNHFIQLRPEEYNPSRVMNRGMELARSEYCIFLNADATPVDEPHLPEAAGMRVDVSRRRRASDSTPRITARSSPPRCPRRPRATLRARR